MGEEYPKSLFRYYDYYNRFIEKIFYAPDEKRTDYSVISFVSGDEKYRDATAPSFKFLVSLKAERFNCSNRVCCSCFRLLG